MADLPQRLRGLLDGRKLTDKEGLTFILATVSDEGFPNLALLSVGEVVAVPRGVRLALHAGSRTESGLRASGRATLLVVRPGWAVSVRLDCRPLETGLGPDLAAYDATVVEVREHDAGYARLTSGIEFELTDRSATARWERTIAALLAADQLDASA